MNGYSTPEQTANTAQHQPCRRATSRVVMATNNGASVSVGAAAAGVVRSTSDQEKNEPTLHPFFLTFSRWKAYCSHKYNDRSRSHQDLTALRHSYPSAMEIEADQRPQQPGWSAAVVTPAASGSGTGTPTLARARPRLPVGLIKPGNSRGKGDVEDLSVAFSSLGTTDFVRKYSRKGRTSGSSTPSSGQSLIRSPVLSPPPESGQGHHHRTGSLTLRRMKSIKLKLQKVKETQELEEKKEEKEESKKSTEPTVVTSRPPTSSSWVAINITKPTQLKPGPKVVFSSLQDLTKVHDSESEWQPTISTPDQLREASAMLSSKMPPPATLPETVNKPCDVPEKRVSLRRKLFSFKSSVSTDSDASTSSANRKQSTNSMDGLVPNVSLRCSFDTEDDEGLGAMDEATEEDGIRIRVPQIVTPGSERKRRSKKGRKKEDRQRGKPDQGPNGNRFLTHPVGDNTMDDGVGSISGTELTLSPQPSVASIDSSLSSDAVAPSYVDVVQDVVSESKKGKHERRNSKQLKHKSKSDPCGNKQKVDISSVIAAHHTHSEPFLEDKKSTLTDHVRGERKISRSENLLINTDEDTKTDKSTCDHDTSGDSSEDVKPPLPTPRQRSKRTKKKSHTVASIIQRIENREENDEEGSRSDKNPDSGRSVRLRIGDAISRASPDTDKKSKRSTLASLTLPLSGKKSSLSRSHSSASVTQKNKNVPMTPATADPKKRPKLPDQLKSSSSDPSSNRTPKSAFTPVFHPIYPQGTLSLFEGTQKEKVKRDLIVQEIYSTEQNYVETLQMLVERFMIPMKSTRTLDSNLIDDIFYKVNEIYMHHATFLTFLGKAATTWDQKCTIGDVIYRNFSKQTVIESYISFIENFPKAEKVLDEISTKSSFQKFVEQTERQSRTKLPLKAMMVKPAQRIPQYELLLKRLYDNTPSEHPDHKLLMKAQSVVHKLALQINSVKENKQGEDMQETLKKLELILMTDLVQPERLYLRHDVVNVMDQKDSYCVWLFSDLVIFSSIKRKSGPVNRKITLLLQSPSGNDFVENVKHKVWLKVALDGLEVLKGLDDSEAIPQPNKDQLEDDARLLTNIVDMSQNLTCAHESLDEVVYQLQGQVTKKLAEHEMRNPPTEANVLQLLATTPEGMTTIHLVFINAEKRNTWEVTFTEAKQNLAENVKEKPPEFIQALPITKTRAGMQFSCAAPIDGMNAHEERDVWVCNSDGYVGHMCLLSLQPEPIVTLNTPLPGCNSRILCICAVPGQLRQKRRGSGRRHGVTQAQAPAINLEDLMVRSTGDEEDITPKKLKKLRSMSESETSDDFQDAEDRDQNDEKQAEPEDRSRSATPERISLKRNRIDSTMPAMWMGTEDGCILIFPSTENIKTTKNKLKLQQSAGVLSILYYDHKIFASLANGDLVVFQKTADKEWDLENPEILCVSNASAPVNKMHMVAGRLWCTTHCEVYIINPSDLHIETTFQANPDSKKGMNCIAASGLAVWMAPQGGASVLLFHATTHEQLLEISIKQAVAQKLQATDDIIRQHKTACLRVTSLLVCKDLLWIGTSAGVLLSLQMPVVSSTTTKDNITSPEVTGLAHGHTGHVRFLTSVDLPQPKFLASFGDQTSCSPPESGLLQKPPWLQGNSSLATHTLTLATKMLIVSGGEGYEDLRSCVNAETAGKDDSVNHLLLWQV